MAGTFVISKTSPAVKQLILTLSKRWQPLWAMKDFWFSEAMALLRCIAPKCESQGETHLTQRELLMGYWLEKVFALSREEKDLGKKKKKVRSIRQSGLPVTFWPPWYCFSWDLQWQYKRRILKTFSCHLWFPSYNAKITKILQTCFAHHLFSFLPNLHHFVT